MPSGLAEHVREGRVSIVGHYEHQRASREDRKVWVAERLIVECCCDEKVELGKFLTRCGCGADHAPLVKEMRSILAESRVPFPYRDYEKGCERSTRRLRLADEVKQALTHGTDQMQGTSAPDFTSGKMNDGTQALTTLASDAEAAVCLENAVVVGDLDVKHHTIEKALEARNCWFLGKVDLRYCDFKQAVAFLDCTFYQEFNSGDRTGSHTVYGKELNCNGSHFDKAASFNGIEVESSAYFHDCRFGLREPKVSKRFPSLSDEYTVDFVTASFGHHIECNDAVFAGPVSFNSIECGGNGIMTNTCFQKKADFTAAAFGLNIQCRDAEFQGPAIFNSVKCNGTGIMTNACFQGDVILRFSSFGRVLRCEDAEFRGFVDCSSMKCDQDGRLNKAHFRSDKELILKDAYFGGNLTFECAEFRGRVDARGLKCDGTGNFKDVTFEADELDCRYSQFGGDLSLRNAYFAGKVRLGQSSIGDRFRLGGSYFERKVELYSTDIGVLEVIDANYHIKKYPLQVRSSKRQDDFATTLTCEDLERIFGKASNRFRFARFTDRQKKVEALFPFRLAMLNLTDISFKRFHGGPHRELARELAVRLCEGQNPTKFSRDPYLQLEKYYSDIGDEDDALDIHYKGHCALRKNAKAYKRSSEEGRVNWSKMKIWGPDLVWKWTTGYGQQMKRLLYIFVIFVVAGTIFFWSDDALTVPSGTEPSVKPQQMQMGPKWLDRPVYSLDLLMPLLDLRGGDVRIPNDTRWSYEVLHLFVGWLLVALLVAWITAIAKGGR